MIEDEYGVFTCKRLAIPSESAWGRSGIIALCLPTASQRSTAAGFQRVEKGNLPELAAVLTEAELQHDDEHFGYISTVSEVRDRLQR